jgi:hypothetical protein
MHEIHQQMATGEIDRDPSNSLFSVRAWATDYGMLGLGGQLGFWVDGRRHVCASALSKEKSEESKCVEYISCHANSVVVIDAHQPLVITGLLDMAAGDHSKSPLIFRCDDSVVGNIATPECAMPEINLGVGKHKLEVLSRSPQDIERAYSIWQIRARSPVSLAEPLC